MVMGEVAKEYELAIIGGGPGGYMAAIRAGQLGISTVLIEKEEVGGTCLNRGCIPSKMLLHISESVKEMKLLQHAGIIAKIDIDAKKIRKKNLDVVRRLRDGVKLLLKSYNIDVMKGEARLESRNFARISGKKVNESVRFGKCIIATGSIPRIPKGVKTGNNIITSREALFLKDIPKRIAILGAGYIAAELGTYFSEMGSEVHLLARSRLLSRIDGDAVSIVQKESFFKVHEQTIIASINKSRNRVQIEFLSSGKRIKLDADKLIIAMGRIPNTKGIGLENAGVNVDEQGYIKVDEKMQTNMPNIYAIGDVVKGPMLAHKAFMQGRAAAEAVADIKSSAYDVNAMPAAVFTHPEIAVVGDIKNSKNVVKFPFSALGKAVATGSKGFIKIGYDNDGRITGATAVGKNASELLGELGLAIEMNAFLEDIEGTVHTHPTMYESIHEAAALALGKPMHYLQKFH